MVTGDGAKPAERRDHTTEILVCGLTTLDIVTRSIPLNQPIGAGCLHPIESVTANPGGLVSNSGTAVARLGLKTAVVSAVGDDVWGQVVRQQLASEGLDVSGLKIVPGQQTPTTVVLLDPGGERSFLFAPGVGAADIDDLILEQARKLKPGSWVLFGYFSLFAEIDRRLPALLRRLQQLGLKTAMDCAGSGISATPLEDLLPALDCYLPSRLEAENQTSETDPQRMINAYRERGAQGLVGLKLGRQGAILSPGRGAFLDIPACQPPLPVVDTTGAGDAFYAGVIAGLARSLSLADAGRLGAAAGAWCITAVGATAGLKGWQETSELAGIRSGGIEAS